MRKISDDLLSKTIDLLRDQMEQMDGEWGDSCRWGDGQHPFGEGCEMPHEAATETLQALEALLSKHRRMTAPDLFDKASHEALVAVQTWARGIAGEDIPYTEALRIEGDEVVFETRPQRLVVGAEPVELRFPLTSEPPFWIEAEE